MKIGRSLFWFNDGDASLQDLHEKFFGLSFLLNRLLNEKYDGAKIKFINIEFNTEATYNLYPSLPKNEPYYFGGHLTFNGLFDRLSFMEANDEGQKRIVWTMACDFLRYSAKKMKNTSLLDATEYAYEKGLTTNLNADYRLVQSEVFLCGRHLLAAVWVHFKPEGMYSKIVLEDKGKIMFSRDLDNARNGIEFFLEMYKSIATGENGIILKGHRDVTYLPLTVPINCQDIFR